MKNLLSVFLTLFIIVFASAMAMAQQISIDTTGGMTRISVPDLVFPTNDPTFFATKNGMAITLAILAVISQYLGSLIPGFRSLKIDPSLKAISIAVALVVIVSYFKGASVMSNLLGLIFSSIPFWQQTFYHMVAKPLLGSSNELVAAVAKSAVEDPTIPYDGVPDAKMPEDGEKKN